MQLKHYAAAFCVMVAVAAVAPTSARAQTTTDLSAMLETLQNLMKQVETLQAQLAALKGEIREEIKAGLAEGMEDDDIKKIQELLATDPTIYPRGIVSGYYGPLTSEAIKRFQERHGLEVTGVVDEETRELMKEYMKERQNGKFPPGLLSAPGISKKVMDRVREGDDGKKYLDCDDKRAAGPLCKNNKQDRSSKNMKNVSSSTAMTAIEAAEDAIEDLKDAILAATSSDEKADAEDDLEDAKDKLADAEKELAAGDYRDAQDKAVEAKRIALRAIDDLTGVRSDDDDDDDDDEDDDDDDDDDED